MQANPYREEWARWLPDALALLSQQPPEYAKALQSLPRPANEPVPFTRPSEPLRVALLTSSGAYDRETQAPFAESSLVGDVTHRCFPFDLDAARLEFADEHYDREGVRADPETVLPRFALRAAGVTTTEHVVSWSGYMLDWPTFLEQTVPQIVARVRADGANAALLTPV